MKRFIVATAFCTTMVLAFLLLYPREALALPCFEQHIWYYDENCQYLAGEYHLNCFGATLNWGATTAQWKEMDWCCGNEGCNIEGDGCGVDGEYLGCYKTPTCPVDPDCF